MTGDPLRPARPANPRTTAGDSPSAYWSRDPAQLMAEMGSGAGGLSSADAAQRLRRYGANTVREPARVTALKLAARQFESPLVLILLNNLLSDLPSIAISTDSVDAGHTMRAQRWNVAEVRRFMIVFGLISTLFDLLTFAILLRLFEADKATFQTTWFVVSLLTELAVVLVLRTRGPAWRSTPSPLLLWTTVLVGAAAFVLPYAGALASAFGFVALSWPLALATALIVAVYVATTELAKRAFFAPPPLDADQRSPQASR